MIFSISVMCFASAYVYYSQFRWALSSGRVLYGYFFLFTAVIIASFGAVVPLWYTLWKF